MVVCAFGALIKRAAAVRAGDPQRASLAAAALARCGAGRAARSWPATSGRGQHHAPDGRPRQRPGVPAGEPSRSRPRTTTAGSRRVCRGSAASCSLRALEERPPFTEQPEDGVTYAEKIGRRGPAARPAPARGRARAHRAGAAPAHRRSRRTRRRDDRSASARSAVPSTPTRRGAGRRPGGLTRDDGRLLLAASRACSSCSRSSLPAGGRWTRPTTCAVTPRRGPPVGGT